MERVCLEFLTFYFPELQHYFIVPVENYERAIFSTLLPEKGIIIFNSKFSSKYFEIHYFGFDFHNE